ncbi:hypothetical protein pdam_00000402 [Pocillopora damicornis]|uniref:Uncharacterized protein n=1 Tax=Pocillopora damicornis TaxID=46731 RepID=A0A3M6UJE9_POCDA|nr:hypothetical protein pdam_00000402 [Pocillopora damicornis]
MEYFRYLEPWLASWNISLDSVHLLSNKTVKWSEIRENFRDLWRNDDWQIRLSWFLIVCTVVNFVFIGIAWKIYDSEKFLLFKISEISAAEHQQGTKPDMFNIFYRTHNLKGPEKKMEMNWPCAPNAIISLAQTHSDGLPMAQGNEGQSLDISICSSVQRCIDVELVLQEVVSEVVVFPPPCAPAMSKNTFGQLPIKTTFN